MPLIGLISASASLAFSWTSRLPPTAALFVAIITTLGWIAVASVWMDCETVGLVIRESVASYCPQHTLEDDDGTATGLAKARLNLAWVVVAAYLIYIVLVIVLVVRTKMRERKGVRLQDLNHEGRQLDESMV